MYLIIKLATDLDPEDIFEGMTEKIETAVRDADSRFLQVELVDIHVSPPRSAV